MNITIKINTDNEAFEADEEGEVVRILRELADTFEREGAGDACKLRDINGNTVGSCRCD